MTNQESKRRDEFARAALSGGSFPYPTQDHHKIVAWCFLVADRCMEYSLTEDDPEYEAEGYLYTEEYDEETTSDNSEAGELPLDNSGFPEGARV